MNRIYELRTQMGITMKEAAARLGMPYTTYVNYEKGTREPNSETLILLARFFGTTIDNLLGKTDALIPPGFQPMPEMSAVPLVGSIACGTPILAEQNIEARIGVPALWQADFALTCHGNSMAAMIQDGDIVCIRKQPEVENGEIAAVRIGEEATLKRFYRQGDTVMLQAENPAFSPLVYTRDQLNEITIEGRVVGICRGI
jgi:repressor LexA|nr:MAG TPA: Repressor protein CI [Caudoviricetes sp.]